ncbi:MaoC-like domain-containing protein [Pseudomonas amygdali pv. tabaci]|uniref:MaoC-like domain-containing protein n=1 Tax=Pseudomonas amygdali pv. tabaci TaxID=322 RepID=A0AAX1VQ36_PSEAJ|nr:MaoC-like domain-containing protein [Pseudomonas amygdali pv. tabaci]RML78014.1 MaoC-like domain-containing protein [Pseudomonas amygdali pv. tabaci]
MIRPQALADAGCGTSTQTTSDKESGMPSVPVTELKHYIGKEAECSDWLTIDQERINLFAEATGDFQFIHVDPVKAAQTPFGATIAHGFLSLSLIPKLMEGIMVLPEGLKMAVNYGMDSVRFVQPVLVNSRVRLKVQLTEVTEKKPGQWLLKAIATLEIEGQEKPAFVAEPLTLCFV